MRVLLSSLLLVLCLGLAGCTFDPADGPADTGGGADGSTIDLGFLEDGGDDDAGPADADPVDLGPLDMGDLDAGDTGPADTGPEDTGPGDGGPEDTGPNDTGVDGGPDDLGVADSGPDDLGVPDTGPGDTGGLDTGVPDTGPEDAGPIDVGAPDTGVNDAGVPNPAASLEFTGLPARLTAGGCAPVSVTRLDVAAQPVAEAVERLVTLVVAGNSGGFFSDGLCTARLSSTRLLAGSASSAIFVGSQMAGTMGLGATTPGITPAQVILPVDPGPPVGLALPAGGGLTWAACSAAQTVSVVDAFGNPVPPTTPIMVSLSVSPAGAARVTSDALCALSTNQAPISNLQTGVDVHLRPNLDGTFVLSASAAGLTGASTTYSTSPCAGGCSGCGAGACCRQGCGSGDCSLSCASTCSCQLDCQGTNGTCTTSCNSGAECGIDCRNVNTCAPNCTSGSTCVVACNGANNCDQISCGPGASCLVYCGSATNCSFNSCAGGPLTCPGGVITCGRPCP